MMNDHNRSWTVNYKGVVDSFAERIDSATTDNPNKLHSLYRTG